MSQSTIKYNNQFKFNIFKLYEKWGTLPFEGKIIPLKANF